MYIVKNFVNSWDPILLKMALYFIYFEILCW